MITKTPKIDGHIGFIKWFKYSLIEWLVRLDLFNDDTPPSGHISRPKRMTVNQHTNMIYVKYLNFNMFSFLIIVLKMLPGIKLEQLECLRFENTIPPPPPPLPPPPHDYPYYGFISDPMSKQDKVKVTNSKNLPKIKILGYCNNLYTAYWSCLIRCANMKWIQLVLWKIQSGHDFVHRQTDRRTDRWRDDVKPVYPPFNFVEAGV